MSERAKIKARAQYARLGKNRVVVIKSAQHFGADLIAADGKVLASVTTKKSGIIKDGKTGGIVAAKVIGALLAKKIDKLKTADLVLDRAGCIYHGRIKAFADALREAGIKI